MRSAHHIPPPRSAFTLVSQIAYPQIKPAPPLQRVSTHTPFANKTLPSSLLPLLTARWCYGVKNVNLSSAASWPFPNASTTSYWGKQAYRWFHWCRGPCFQQGHFRVAHKSKNLKCTALEFVWHTPGCLFSAQNNLRVSVCYHLDLISYLLSIKQQINTLTCKYEFWIQVICFWLQ